MKLAVAFWEQRAPKSHFYLLTPDGVVPRTGGWFGIFIHTPAPQDTTRLAYLSHNLKMLQNPMLYFVQSFVFFKTGLGDGNIKDIVAGLEACDRSAIGAASLAWVPDTAPVAALPMVPLVDRRTRRFAVLLDAPETRPLVLLEDGAQPASLQLAARGGRAKIEVDANAADDGLVLSCDAGFSLLRGTPKGKPAPPLFRVPPGTAVQIDAQGAAAGCLRAAGALAAPVSDLVVGFRYELGARGPLAAPALNAPDGLDGHAATLCLSPNAVLDPARSGFALDPAGAGFASTFRTRGGGTIALAPDPGGGSRLVFNRGNGAMRYLTLDGPFVASPPPGAGDSAFLCGLSGVEYIALEAGDRMAFSAGQPAAITVSPDSADPVFAADPAGAATTAHRTIRTDKNPRAYVSEPDNSPFFAPGSAGSDPLQLGYLPLSRIALAPGAASAFFPALPYAAMPGLGAAQDTALVRAFELHHLNPARRAAIAKAATGQAAAMAGATTCAVTPQGHKATFRNGQWTALDVAAMQGPDIQVAIRFEAEPGKALPDALQDAFLTNQQFVVMTQDRGNLGRFTPKIRMSGWEFDLDLSVNTTIGSYRNVLIFKSASASLAQLAATPDLWTGTAAFNSEADPEGAYLSAWLTAYLDEARRIHDGGRGVASLGAFCALIDDPDWNGVLALNVGVDPAALAPEIEPLLVGIDDSLFAAHHIGNLVNHVAQQTGGDFALNSSVFGLIRYTDPAYRGGQGDIAYLPTPDDFDFRVLTLEAVFEDARLTHFSNRSLNRLAAAKKAIVEKMVAFVTEIRLDGTATAPAGDAALTAAQDRYRQECVIEMGNFYEMASVAVLDLKTALGGLDSPEPMNLFGQPVSGPGPKKAPPSTDNYSLTGGKAAMTPSGGPMAIGLFARNKTLSSTFTADLTFTIGAIEHDPAEFRIGETVYTSGGWLSFLDPPAPLAIGKVAFPIPLRAFPTPPDLGQQQARGLLDPGALPRTAAETLALAKSWALDGSYRHGFVAQDRVELEVTVNQGNRQGLLFATGLDVIDALIAFDRLLPELQALFVAQGLAAIRSPDRADNPVLKAALDSFATLAQDIAESGWSPIMPEAFAEIAATGLVRRSRRFAIEDGVQKPGQPWLTRISISDKGAADLDILPTIGIDGYRTQVAAKDASSASYTYLDTATGKPLTEDQGRALAERRVIVAPAGKGAPFGSALNVIDRQDGTMAMQILRNARFQEAFRYATDWVRYPTPDAPQLDITAPIDIADLAGAPRPLAAHLAALHLFSGAASGGAPILRLRNLRLACSAIAPG